MGAKGKVWPKPVTARPWVRKLHNRHLEACGVKSHTGIVDSYGRRGKGRSVYFRDPDGSLLEFITYPDSAGD